MNTALLRRRRKPTARGGFTLIELMAVILIIAILMAFLLPKIPEMIDNAEVTACRKNMEEIYKGFMSYKLKYDGMPRKSGAQLVGSLISRGVWENTEASAKKLTCPGVEFSALDIGYIENPEEWFADIESVTGGYTAYAGRNMKAYPLRKFPGSGKEPLVSDDNDGANNHRTTTNVLMADGVVFTYELYEEIERGNADAEEKLLVVGENSPIETLQKLTLD